MLTFTFTETLRPGTTPISISPSGLKRTGCERAFAYNCSGLRTRALDPKLVFGNAVHKFLSERHNTAIEEPFRELAARAEAEKILRTVTDDMKQLNTVLQSFPRDIVPRPLIVDKRQGVEFYFEIPWLETVYQGKTYTLVLRGLIDQLSFSAGILRIYDYKSVRNYKTDEGMANYKNDKQLFFYAWLMWKWGHVFLTREQALAAREFSMTAQIVLIQVLTYPKWTLSSPMTFNENGFVEFEDLLREEIMALASKVITDSTRKTGIISNSCPRCDFNALCHTMPGNETAVMESLYFKKEFNTAKD